MCVRGWLKRGDIKFQCSAFERDGKNVVPDYPGLPRVGISVLAIYGFLPPPLINNDYSTSLDKCTWGEHGGLYIL